MDRFLIGKELSTHSIKSNYVKKQTCKRKHLYEVASDEEIQNAYDHFLSALSQEYANSPSHLSFGIIDNKLVRITKLRGKYFKMMGFSQNNNLFLHPEEAVFLTELNKLQILHNNLPLSIQQVYNQLFDSENAFSHYLVYSRLSCLNYNLRKRFVDKIPKYISYSSKKQIYIPKSINLSINNYLQFFNTNLLINETNLDLDEQNTLISTSGIQSISDVTENLRSIVKSDSVFSYIPQFLYDVYENSEKDINRVVNFSKRYPTYPDYVLTIMSPYEQYPNVTKNNLEQNGLTNDISVLLSIVDGSDISFHVLNHFQIPTLNYAV